MFLVWWLVASVFGVLATVSSELYVVWFFCSLGCFILGLIDLMKDGY